MIKRLILFFTASVLSFAQINVTSADYVQQGKLTSVADAGANDTYTGCPTVAIRAYVTGMEIAFKPNTVNTGAASLNVCSLGAKSIKTVAGADPSDGDLAAGKWYKLVYDGTNLQIVGGVGSGTSLPTQTSNANKALMTDGSSASWNRFVKNLAVSSDLSLTCSNGADITSGECTISVGGNVALLDANNDLAGITSFPASTTQTITGTSSTILCNATRVAITAASAYTLSGVATIADPVKDGQVCIIQNVGSNDITLTDGSTQNLKLGASTVAISAGQPLLLIWDSTTGLWTRQVTPSSSSSPVTLLGNGGSSTTYTITSAASTGVAPNFSVTVPASPATGSRVSCIITNVQADGGVGGHTQLVRLSAYLNGTKIAETDDTNASQTGAMYRFDMMINSGGTVQGQMVTYATSGTVLPPTSMGAQTVSTASATTLEFRPYFFSGTGDDTFAIPSYTCTLLQ